MKPFRSGRRGLSAPDEGFTLVELLVAAAVAATVLSAAYGWLWNVAALAERTDDRAQAATLAAAASRAVAADVHACLRVGEPPSGSRSFAVARARARPRRRRGGGRAHRLGPGARRGVAQRVRHVPRRSRRAVLGRLRPCGRKPGSRATRCPRPTGPPCDLCGSTSRPPWGRRPSAGASRRRWVRHEAQASSREATPCWPCCSSWSSPPRSRWSSSAPCTACRWWRARTRAGGAPPRPRGERSPPWLALCAGIRSRRPVPPKEATLPPRGRGGSRGCRLPAASATGWPRVAARTVTAAGRASHRDDLALELRSEQWAMGVTCAADAEVAAPLTVTGSGIYVGGSLRGRENVRFVQGAGPLTPAGVPVDGVRGELFPAAAVHGGAGIFARGVEVHDAPSPGEFPDDTDRHAGVPVPDEWLSGVSAEFLLAARGRGDGAGARADRWAPAAGRDLAGDGGRARRRAVPSPPAGGRSRHRGVAAGRGRPAARRGPRRRRPRTTRRDSRCSPEGSSSAGRLAVRGPVIVEGSVHARSFSIEAPMSIVVPPAWRACCLCRGRCRRR